LKVLETSQFADWVVGLRDIRAKAKVVSRIRQATIGNLGDVAPVGGGISEMRIHHGPGYRVYFLTQGKKAILLLLGGTKRSQKRDVTRARKLAEEY